MIYKQPELKPLPSQTSVKKVFQILMILSFISAGSWLLILILALVQSTINIGLVVTTIVFTLIFASLAVLFLFLDKNNKKKFEDVVDKINLENKQIMDKYESEKKAYDDALKPDKDLYPFFQINSVTKQFRSPCSANDGVCNFNDIIDYTLKINNHQATITNSNSNSNTNSGALGGLSSLFGLTGGGFVSSSNAQSAQSVNETISKMDELSITIKTNNILHSVIYINFLDPQLKTIFSGNIIEAYQEVEAILQAIIKDNNNTKQQ